MKQSQWILAAVVLAGMIFVVTFAMNYLGGSGQTTVEPETLQPAREVFFLRKDFPPPNKDFPPPNVAYLEDEERATGFVDYWFYNPNDETVQIGLDRTNCACGSVEVFVLPKERQSWLPRIAGALVGVGPAGGLASTVALMCSTAQLERGVEMHELLNKNEMAPVGGHDIGWVRLRWKPRPASKQTLLASLWFDKPGMGKMASLSVRLHHIEPLRVTDALRIQPLRDKELQAGYTTYINCWSSTRPSLNLEVTTDAVRGKPASDPFVVGKPQAMTPDEIRQLERENNDISPTKSDENRGQVLCAYKIPITLHAMSADGTTPFDVGPFHRRIGISSPDIVGEARTVLVLGRVRGLVEIGNDDEGGEINFHTFSGVRGKIQDVYLESQQTNLTLSVDHKRTRAEFLQASLKPTEAPEGRKAWKLTVKVLPGKASGEFPRPNNPFYEDSAIYLKGEVPDQPVRTIRIPVKGRATGG